MRWTNRDEQMLRDLAAQGLSSSEIAKRMQRSSHAIRRRAQQLRVRFGFLREWSADDERLLRDLVNMGTPRKEIAERLGRTYDSVRTQIKRLGLGKWMAQTPPEQKMVRPCLCCGQAFLSEGPHNRLCTACRRLSPGPMDTPVRVWR